MVSSQRPLLTGFHESVSSWHLSILFGPFLIFTKSRGGISSFGFIAGAFNTGDKQEEKMPNNLGVFGASENLQWLA